MRTTLLITLGCIWLAEPCAADDLKFSPYVRADFGWTRHPEPEVAELVSPAVTIDGIGYPAEWINWEDEEMTRGATIGGGIGLRLGPNLRVDVTGEQRSKVALTSARNVSTLGSFDVESTAILANIYFDLPIGRGITPYAGAGLGQSRLSTSNSEAFIHNGGRIIRYLDESHEELAHALMAGVAVDLFNGLVVDAGFGHINLGAARTGHLITLNGFELENYAEIEMISNEFRIGLRYELD